MTSDTSGAGTGPAPPTVRPAATDRRPDLAGAAEQSVAGARAVR